MFLQEFWKYFIERKRLLTQSEIETMIEKFKAAADSNKYSPTLCWQMKRFVTEIEAFLFRMKKENVLEIK